MSHSKQRVFFLSNKHAWVEVRRSPIQHVSFDFLCFFFRSSPPKMEEDLLTTSGWLVFDDPTEPWHRWISYLHNPSTGKKQKQVAHIHSLLWSLLLTKKQVRQGFRFWNGYCMGLTAGWVGPDLDRSDRTCRRHQDTGAPVLEGSRGSEVITVTTPMEEWCLAAESRNFGGWGLFPRKLTND